MEMARVLGNGKELKYSRLLIKGPPLLGCGNWLGCVMKTISLLFTAFVWLATAAMGRTFPPVLLSADLEDHGRGGEVEKKRPQHYVLYVAPYDEFGSIAAGGERPPSAETLARIVQAALPADRFVPIVNKSDELDTVIGVQWGEVSPRGPQPFVSAREGGVLKPIWAIGVGRTHVQPFLLPSERGDLNEELDRDRYFLLISSYDTAALRQGKVSIRWQTRTSVDSIQVGAAKAWGYLAGVAQTHLAQLIDRPKLVSDAPFLEPAPSASALISVDDILPGASRMLTFQKATPPF
jgi:hypothetical protein